MADTVSVVYDGDHAAVDVPVAGLVDVAVGQQVDVAPDVAKSLIESGQFKAQKPAKAEQKEGK